MSANASSLLTLNPLIVYVALGLYAILFVCLFAYFRKKLRVAGHVLQLVRTEWEAAASQHTGLVETARERIAHLSAPQPVAAPAAPAPVSVDIRTQVAAMGKKGLTVSDIARSCGLPEGEVDVLLGLARLQR